MSDLLLLTLLVTMVMASTKPRDVCLRLLQEDGMENDVTSDLMFLPVPQSTQYACVKEQHELRCCAHNFQLLRWHHYDATSQSWMDVELSSYVYFSPEGDPRTLVLEQTDLSDSGWYRCTATDDQGQRISHKISLHVEDCPTMDTSPVVSLVPDGTLRPEPGDDVNLTCHVYFGPNYNVDMEAILYWIRTTSWGNGSLADNDVWVPDGGIYPTDPRIQIDIRDQWDSQVSVLTLHNITPADFGNYSCRAKNTLGWSEIKMVRLLPVEPDCREIKPDTLGLMAVCVLGAALCVTILGLLWRKDIRLLYKDNLAKPRKPDANYDALITYNESHNPDCLFVVEDLLPVLEGKFGYRLCITQRDFIAGPDLGDVIVDNIHHSQALVFVVTEAMLRHEWCDFVFQYVAPREYTNLVFIMREPIREEVWSTNLAPLRNILNASKHVFEWPSESRKRNTFWKELRLSLPAKLRTGKQSLYTSGTSLQESSHELLYV